VHILSAILTALLILTSLFMICLVLIQRGKGGGLAGAFGGMGGSSAFGTKAGDVFTRVTMITALIWIIMSMMLVVLYNRGSTSAWDGDASPGGGRAKQVAPTPAGARGKTPASKSTAAPSPATSGSSPAPLSDPVISVEPGPTPKSK
jgi:preprotein translocase subunit SecG